MGRENHTMVETTQRYDEVSDPLLSNTCLKVEQYQHCYH